MHHLVLRIGVALAVLMMPHGHAWAEDPQGDFFPHDFAKNPLDGRSISSAPTQDQSALSSDDHPTEKDIDDGETFIELGSEPTPTATPVTNDDRSITEAVRTWRVRTVGAIVNCEAEEHFVATLGELTELVARYDLDVGMVYGVCEAPKISPEMLMPLLVRKGQFRVDTKVPQPYQVTRSPAWIVTSEQGDFVLEGVARLAKYFNQKGEFLER